jgi:REP element-mobilizing transposase RayT
MSTTRILTHIVFATKRRELTINNEHCDDLYRVMASILKKYDCYPLRINGIENHVHILLNVSPVISISELVQRLKRATGIWIKESHMFPLWFGWCEGYFACSVSPKMQDAVLEYIKNQKVHHRHTDWANEYMALLRSAGVSFDGYMLE